MTHSMWKQLFTYLTIIAGGIYVLCFMAGCHNGQTISQERKHYVVYCIKGVSYAVFNEFQNNAVMSIMLDREGKVIPCESGDQN